MDQVEGVDVVAMNERLEGVTRASSKARSTKETTIDVALDLDGDVSASAVSTGIATLDGLLADVRERRASDSTSTPRVTSGSTTITPPKTSPSPSGRCSRRRWGIRLGVTAWVARWLPCGTGRGDADDDDAAVVEVVMDLSNRPFLANGLEFRDEFVGDLSAEMIDHLFMSVTANGQMTTHVVSHAAGGADGDLAAAARAFGRCLKQCVAVDPRRAGQVASSKGTLRVETRG